MIRFSHRVSNQDIKTARYLDPHNCFVCRCITRFTPNIKRVTTDYHTCVLQLTTGETFIAKIPDKVANLLRDFDFSKGELMPSPFDLLLHFEPLTDQTYFEYQ